MREESSKWRERCLGAEQRLSEVGRSHELLLATLVGTCERLLSPFGVSPEDSALPLAWQQQLHSELSAVIQAPLVVQASRDIQSAHQHAVDAASVVPTAEAPVTPSAPPADVQEVGTAGTAGARQRREEQQQRERLRQRGGWTPASGRIERGWRRRGEPSEGRSEGQPAAQPAAQPTAQPAVVQLHAAQLEAAGFGGGGDRLEGATCSRARRRGQQPGCVVAEHRERAPCRAWPAAVPTRAAKERAPD